MPTPVNHHGVLAEYPSSIYYVIAQSKGISRFMPFPRTFALSEHKHPQLETEIGVPISVSGKSVSRSCSKHLEIEESAGSRFMPFLRALTQSEHGLSQNTNDPIYHDDKHHIT